MINFPFGTNGKSIILGVPILKHITANVNEAAIPLADKTYLSGWLT